MDNTTTRIPTTILDELEKALQSVSYGSIEIFVQDKVITQITVRNIKKTSVGITKSTLSRKTTLSSSHINASSKVQIKLRP